MEAHNIYETMEHIADMATGTLKLLNTLHPSEKCSHYYRGLLHGYTTMADILGDHMSKKIGLDITDGVYKIYDLTDQRCFKCKKIYPQLLTVVDQLDKPDGYYCPTCAAQKKEPNCDAV